MTKESYDKAKEIIYQLQDINEYAKRNLENILRQINVTDYLNVEQKAEICVLVEKHFNIDAQIAELNKEFACL